MNKQIDFIRNRIFNINDLPGFNELALQIFHYQAENNSVYSDYLKFLDVNHKVIEKTTQIPFMPIEFFKKHQILSNDIKTSLIFESSGTGNEGASKHFIADIHLYEESFTRSFSIFYEDVKQYNVLALLPSYFDKPNSSLLYMVKKLINLSENPVSGFYLNKQNDLTEALFKAKSNGKRTLLLGVSYALLDLAEETDADLSGCIIMETGGMKGRKREMIREELHEILTERFNVECIHSEFGMTELCSQAYSKGNGIFSCPPWMKVLVREEDDPFSVTDKESNGGLNVIDLANIYSCSFIATQDLCRLKTGGTFEILGRFDNSDIRGCNQMV